jgi:hypothetical protein
MEMEMVRDGRHVGLAQGPAEKTFTRAAVLAVLKSLMTRWDDDGTERGGLRFRAAKQALDEAVSTFERME